MGRVLGSPGRSGDLQARQGSPRRCRGGLLLRLVHVCQVCQQLLQTLAQPEILRVVPAGPAYLEARLADSHWRQTQDAAPTAADFASRQCRLEIAVRPLQK